MTENLEPIRTLILKETEAFLGTVEEKNPFVSATRYLFDDSGDERLGDFFLLLSHLARHTKNIEQNREGSLLIIENRPEISILERCRVTVIGQIQRVTDEEEEGRLRRLYQNRFPNSGILLELPDFHFYCLRPRELHWIGGFGKIKNWKVTT